MSIEALTPESINFHTCRFRSENEHERLVKRCSCQGGDYTVRGYWCEKREIFDVKEEICGICPEYQDK